MEEIKFACVLHANSLRLPKRAACEENDPASITHALVVVARSKDITEIAKRTGLTRKNLNKALTAEGNPEFATVLKVLAALDLKFAVKAA